MPGAIKQALLHKQHTASAERKESIRRERLYTKFHGLGLQMGPGWNDHGSQHEYEIAFAAKIDKHPGLEKALSSARYAKVSVVIVDGAGYWRNGSEIHVGFDTDPEKIASFLLGRS